MTSHMKTYTNKYLFERQRVFCLLFVHCNSYCIEVHLKGQLTSH